MDNVDEIMLEFGSFTCAEVSLETVQIIHAPDEIKFNYDLAANLWQIFRQSTYMTDKYGPLNKPTPPFSQNILEWYEKNIKPVFKQFINIGQDIEGPYYLCICTESGDEYFVRRSLPNDKFTAGKFMMLNCEFSKMSDCTPRNKLREVRTEDGEYLLFVIHKPGTMEDQERLKILLDQYAKDGVFALV